jgi:hypothetical protein
MSYIKPYWLQKSPHRWLLVDCDPVLGCIDLAEIVVEKNQWKIIIRFNIDRVSQRDRDWTNRVTLEDIFQPYEDVQVAKEAVEDYFGQIIESGAR